MNETLVFEVKNKIARITLSNTENKNALSLEMIKELISSLEKIEWESSENVKFTVLEGSGDYFCSGFDLKGIEKYREVGSDKILEDIFLFAKLLRKLSSLPFPVIARIKGGAIGSGVGILSTLDYIIAEESSKFSIPEIKSGIVPAITGLYLSRKIGLSNFAHFLLSGEEVKSEEALRMGLVNKIAGRGDFQKDSNNVEEKFLSLSPQGLRRMKQVLLKTFPLPKTELEEYCAMQATESIISSGN